MIILMKRVALGLLLILLVSSSPAFLPQRPLPSVDNFRNLEINQQRDAILKISSQDPSQAWEYLKSALIINGELTANAHQMAHLVGNEIYRQYGFSGVTLCDQSFSFGCFHGVTEKMFLDHGIASLKEIEKECTRFFPERESDNFVGCIHGVGHGLFIWRESDAREALEDCDLFDQSYNRYCYSGVFMERNETTPQTDPSSDDPWLFCGSLETRFQLSCAGAQPQYFIQILGWNLSRSAQGCQMATSEDLKERCFRNFGTLVAQFARGSFDKIVNDCSLTQNPEGRDWCLNQAAHEVIWQKYPNWSSVSSQLLNLLQ